MNKHIQTCDGFNPNQTHFIASTGTNSIQLIKTSTPSLYVPQVTKILNHVNKK